MTDGIRGIGILIAYLGAFGSGELITLNCEAGKIKICQYYISLLKSPNFDAVTIKWFTVQ